MNFTVPAKPRAAGTRERSHWAWYCTSHTTKGEMFDAEA
jgi:hypothetical protein